MDSDAGDPYAAEIASVVDVYGERARVTSRSGFGQPSVSVRPFPKRPSVLIELQLHGDASSTMARLLHLQESHLSLLLDTYPYDIPTLSFEGLPNAEAAELHQHLDGVASEHSGHPMLLTLISAAVQWTERGPSEKQKMQSTDQMPPVDVSSPSEITGAHVPPVQKMDRMRTAEDVISRIRWDDQLKGEDFVVVYLDRFTGEVETSFAEVDWADPPFPEHRIQCFKFRDVTVWDKRIPLDHVFGTRGEGLKIEDVLDRDRRHGGNLLSLDTLPIPVQSRPLYSSCLKLEATFIKRCSRHW